MIDRKQLASMAEELISFCREHNPNPYDYLEDDPPIIKRIQGDVVRIEAGLRPSSYGSYAYTLSYIIQGTGIPLEVRMNALADETKIILKSREVITGYIPFGKDTLGNIYQKRALRGISIDEITRELRQLAGA